MEAGNWAVFSGQLRDLGASWRRQRWCPEQSSGSGDAFRTAPKSRSAAALHSHWVAAQPLHLLLAEAAEALEDEEQLVHVGLAGEQRQARDQLRQQAACGRRGGSGGSR